MRHQTKLQMLMDKKEKYMAIFGAFADAPMKDFMEGLFKGLGAEKRKSLVVEDVSYHRLSANTVTLEAFFCLAPVESNRWIWARVVKDDKAGTVEEMFFTRYNYREQTLPSLEACIDYYLKEDDK